MFLNSFLRFLIGSLCAGFMLVNAAAADAPQDTLLKGYTLALGQHVLKLKNMKVTVKEGQVTLQATGGVVDWPERALAALSKAPGFEALVVVGPDGRARLMVAATGSTKRDEATKRERKSDPKLAVGGSIRNVSPDSWGLGRIVEVGFLPGSKLFDDFVADPRVPHFSAAYLRYMDDPEIENVGAVSFGHTFALYRDRMPGNLPGFWQLNFEGAVYGIFDLTSDSTDLVNADYFAGIPITYRHDQGDTSLQVRARVYHQSSHLGDEFLLRSRAIQEGRINLSYEAVDIFVAHQWGLGPERHRYKAYGGIEYIFHREPENLKPWSFQLGAEYRSPISRYTLFDRTLDVGIVAGLDARFHEDANFQGDYSIVAGLEFSNEPRSLEKLRLLLQYYVGRSPNGQFFRREIEYLGIGVHLDF